MKVNSAVSIVADEGWPDWVPGSVAELRLDAGGEVALLRLRGPDRAAGRAFDAVVVAPRHRGGSLASLGAGDHLLCAAAVPSATELERGDWNASLNRRGAVWFIATVRVDAL